MVNHTNPLVRQQGDRLITTSLAISQHFGRKHKNVMQAINSLNCSSEFARLNFQPGTYQDGNQQKRPMFTITRDGFMFLCMGFTGEQAAVWKERYIKAFNQMEAELHYREKPEIVGLDVPTYIRRELLAARPLWQKIQRYKQSGLNHAEIAKLVDRNVSTVREHVRRMEKCGLLETPANLPALQQMAHEHLGVGA